MRVAQGERGRCVVKLEGGIGVILFCGTMVVSRERRDRGEGGN